MNRGNPKPPALHEHFENLGAKGKTLAKAAAKESNEQINQDNTKILEKVKERGRNVSTSIFTRNF